MENNLETLRAEQLRLKSMLKEKEFDLTQKFEYAKDHFGSMLINTLLPFSNDQREKVSGTFDKINSFILKLMQGKNEEGKAPIANGILKSAQILTAGLVFKYLKKLF